MNKLEKRHYDGNHSIGCITHNNLDPTKPKCKYTGLPVFVANTPQTVKFSVPVKYLSHHYQIDVTIWDTLDSLRGGVSGADDAAAITKSYRVEQIVSSSLGTNEHDLYVSIDFSRDNLGGGVVSHEATHATLRIVADMSDADTLLIDDDSEEAIAHTVGDIVSKIYSQLYERGVL